MKPLRRWLFVAILVLPAAAACRPDPIIVTVISTRIEVVNPTIEVTRLVTVTPSPTPVPESMVRAALSVRQGQEGCIAADFQKRYEEAVVAQELSFLLTWYTASGFFSPLPGIARDYRNCFTVDRQVAQGTYFIPYRLTIRRAPPPWSTTPSSFDTQVITTTTTFVRIDVVAADATPTPSPTAGPTPVLDTICDYGDGSRVVATAQIRPLGFIVTYRDSRWNVPSRVNSTTKAHNLTLRIRQGDGPNEMDSLPYDFTNADLVIRANDGRMVGVGDNVRVAGEVVVNADQSGCTLEVDTIEALGQ